MQSTLFVTYVSPEALLHRVLGGVAVLTQYEMHVLRSGNSPVDF